MTVKYQDYKKYEGKSTIRYGDVVEDKTNPPDKKNTAREEEMEKAGSSSARRGSDGRAIEPYRAGTARQKLRYWRVVQYQMPTKVTV